MAAEKGSRIANQRNLEVGRAASDNQAPLGTMLSGERTFHSSQRHTNQAPRHLKKRRCQGHNDFLKCQAARQNNSGMIQSVKKRFVEAEWMKLSDAEIKYSISRPELFRGIVRNDLDGAHLLKPGKKKGVWLVSTASVENYIRSFMPGGSRHIKAPPTRPVAVTK